MCFKGVEGLKRKWKLWCKSSFEGKSVRFILNNFSYR